jgi:hypothetical protein
MNLSHSWSAVASSQGADACIRRLEREKHNALCDIARRNTLTIMDVRGFANCAGVTCAGESLGLCGPLRQGAGETCG